MAEHSKIEWTDHTFNPWRGCTKVSPGCEHCYAETLSKRNPAVLGQWGKGKPRVLASEDMWRQPLKWARQTVCDGCRTVLNVAGGECPTCHVLTRNPRVFCASLADWLDDEVPIQWLGRLLALIYLTPNLDWLLLTKRPENFQGRIEAAAARLSANECEDLGSWAIDWMNGHAPHNVWLGTTVEDQTRANERIQLLLSIPAQVRFLSCEPLLGAVNLRAIDDIDGNRLDSLTGAWGVEGRGWTGASEKRINLVICGGESGPQARPMHPDWARSLRDQCAAAKVPFFFKQWGEYENFDASECRTSLTKDTQISADLRTGFQRVGKVKAGRLLDGREHNGFPQLEGRDVK